MSNHVKAGCFDNVKPCHNMSKQTPEELVIDCHSTWTWVGVTDDGQCMSPPAVQVRLMGKRNTDQEQASAAKRPRGGKKKEEVEAGGAPDGSKQELDKVRRSMLGSLQFGEQHSDGSSAEALEVYYGLPSEDSHMRHHAVSHDPCPLEVLSQALPHALSCLLGWSLPAEQTVPGRTSAGSCRSGPPAPRV